MPTLSNPTDCSTWIKVVSNELPRSRLATNYDSFKLCYYSKRLDLGAYAFG